MNVSSNTMNDDELPERLDVCLRCPESFGVDPGMSCMSLDEQGQLMVTGCQDGRNIVWDLETRGVRVVLEDGRWQGCGPVESVLLSQDGVFVLSCHSLRKAEVGSKKLFVLWRLGRSSEASVVATHEMVCSSETGTVSLCGIGSPVVHRGVLMMVLLTLGGMPMCLRVHVKGERLDMKELSETINTIHPSVGVGSNPVEQGGENIEYSIDVQPLSFPLSQKVTVEKEPEGKNVEKNQGSASSGGTTITDTRMHDVGGDLTSKRVDNSIIGRKVDVFWDGDGVWFRGTVNHLDESRMFVVYEDGDEEWVSFHGDIPWRYADVKESEPLQNALMAYCVSKDIVSIYDVSSMRLTLHKVCDLSSVIHAMELESVHTLSGMEFSRDGSLLALTYGSGFIELFHIGDEMKLVKRLDFLECSAGSTKERKHEWICSAFSPSGTYLFSSITMDRNENKHCILTWDHEKNTAKNLLQGQGSKILAMECHPVPIPMQIIALSDDGCVYIWSSIMHQNWSVFQPEFETLDRNREYIELETEFDLPPLQSTMPVGEGKSRVLHDVNSDEEILID